MITQEQIKRLLDYNPDTGELVWKFSYQRPDVEGKRAGWFDKTTGYWKISIDKRNYCAAKVIWLWVYGELPDKVPDHKDNDRSNDKLDNLRLASKNQNAMNSKLNSRNTSGFKGVSFSNTMKRWYASIQINGVSKNLGYYNTPEEAHTVWYKAACEAFGQEFVRVS